MVTQNASRLNLPPLTFTKTHSLILTKARISCSSDGLHNPGSGLDLPGDLGQEHHLYLPICKGEKILT